MRVKGWISAYLISPFFFLCASWSLRGFMISRRQRHWVRHFVPLFGCRAEVSAEPPAFEEVEWSSCLRRLTQSAYMTREMYGYFSLLHVWVSLTAESAAVLLWDRQAKGWIHPCRAVIMRDCEEGFVLILATRNRIFNLLQ